MLCPSCGEAVPDGSHLCQSCGWDSYAHGSTPGEERPSREEEGKFHDIRRDVNKPVNRVYIVVAVTIVVLLITTTYVLMLFEAVNDEVPDNVTLNLAPADMRRRSIDGEVYWDAVFHINKVTPREANVRWSDVRVRVWTANGSIVVDDIRPQPDDPGRYDDGDGDRVEIEAWYVDLSGNGGISQNETFKVTGLPEFCEGATVHMTWSGPGEGNGIASSTLPFEFP